MELADVTDSKSVELITRVGSSPTAGTEKGAQDERLPFIMPISGLKDRSIRAFVSAKIGMQ